jgi:hypothetical protein
MRSEKAKGGGCGVIEFITTSPTLNQIAAYQLSPESEERIEYLLDQNGEGKITPEEYDELEDYLRVEHIMRGAKLVALEKLTP